MAALAYGCTEDKGEGTLDADYDGFDVNSDCDDNNPDVNPDAWDLCEDGIDNDCQDGDAQCPVDDDNDGFVAEEDCNDRDPDVNPDAQEDCMNDVDDNCDELAPVCISPDLTYAPSSPGNFDAYGVAVLPDRVVFGEPSGGAPGVGDGRALFFDAETYRIVDESEAVLVSEGEVGSASAYGSVINHVGQHLCIGADYWDTATTDDVGKTWCFPYSAVSFATGTLDLADASFTTSGTSFSDCSSTEAEVDVNGDLESDLVVYTSHGVHVIVGDGNGWSGDYVVPADATHTLGDCAGSNTGWCGFARALMNAYPASFAVSGEGGSSEVSIYDMPISGGTPPPDATATVDRFFPDNAAAILSEDAFAFGKSSEDEVTFVDAAGNLLGTLQGPQNSSFGYWLTTTLRMDGRELLLVGAPDADSPEPGTQAMGLVYVFDINAIGLPTTWRQADFILLPPSDPSDFTNCGHRVGAGITYHEMDAYTMTTIVTGCRGSGGAAYHLHREFNGARLVAAQDIYSVGPNSYEIRQWVVNAVKNHLHWVHHLVQTEAVRNAQDEIVGWRLHAIAVDSPLHRAGLRNGDVIRKINGVDVTTPAVITAIWDAVKNSNALTVGFVRNGTPKQFSYAIVQ